MNDERLPISQDDEAMFALVRRACERHDPMPPGMVDRIAEVVGELSRHDPDLELELMLVVERFRELVGVRGARSAPVRVGGEGVDLLVRVAVAEDEGKARLDGWVVPAVSGPVTVHEVGGEGHTYGGMAGDSGRFEFPDLPTGFYRVSLQLADDRSFGTPAFEI